MILIHPPVAKPSELPAGIAKLAGYLKRYNVRYTVIDANMEGIFSLLGWDGSFRSMGTILADGKIDEHGQDAWTTRALRHLRNNIATLTSRRSAENIDRYRRAVIDVNRALEASVSRSSVRLSLANYIDRELSPVRSADLIRASETPERNPFFPYFKERLPALLELEQPEVVGFSLNYLSQALCTFAMIGFLRREFPGLKVVLGGGLVTSWVRRPGWRDPFQGLVDTVVAGPGERQLLSLCGVESPEEHATPDCAVTIPGEYLSPGKVLPYSASSGCYWNRCSFCPERAEGNPYRPVPVDRVVTDIQYLISEVQPDLVHMLDNALSPILLETIAGCQIGVPWYGFARISPLLADAEFCHALKRSGCVMLQLGLESGDQGVLNSMNKGFDLKTASMVLDALKRAEIATYAYLIFGTPSEAAEEARKTLDFTVRHSDKIDFLNLAIFNLPANSPDGMAYETGDFYYGDLSLYKSFAHPKGWERKLVRQFLNREFRRHPAVASILRKEPPIFTSNHAPFFAMQK